MTSPLSSPQDRERAEFEKWARNRNHGILSGFCDGNYIDPEDKSNWEAWQAARRQERKRTLQDTSIMIRKWAEGVFRLLNLGDHARLGNTFIAVLTDCAETLVKAAIREERRRADAWDDESCAGG